MFGAINIVKNGNKEKYVYSGYGIVFDGEGSWSFNDDTVRNVVIFAFNNSFLSHTGNLKDDFFILSAGDAFSINGSFGASEKKSNITFSKGKTKFCILIVVIAFYL